MFKNRLIKDKQEMKLVIMKKISSNIKLLEKLERLYSNYTQPKYTL